MLRYSKALSNLQEIVLLRGSSPWKYTALLTCGCDCPSGVKGFRRFLFDTRLQTSPRAQEREHCAAGAQFSSMWHPSNESSAQQAAVAMADCRSSALACGHQNGWCSCSNTVHPKPISDWRKGAEALNLKNNSDMSMVLWTQWLQRQECDMTCNSSKKAEIHTSHSTESNITEILKPNQSTGGFVYSLSTARIQCLYIFQY